MHKFNIIKHLLAYFYERKKWWLIPILTVLLFFGFLFIFAQSSVVAPFIYTLF